MCTKYACMMLAGVWRTCSDLLSMLSTNRMLTSISFWCIFSSTKKLNHRECIMISILFSRSRQCNVKRWNRIENIYARCSIRTSYQLNTFLLIYERHPLKLDSIRFSFASFISSKLFEIL